MGELSASQVRWYQEQGYLIVENVVSLEQIERIKQRTTDIAEGRVSYARLHMDLEPGSNGRRSLQTVRKLTGCTESDSVFLEHARDNTILDMVEALIGQDLKIFDSQLFMKPPGGVEKPYHQDSAYFSIKPMSLVTCWTALDDVTLENGCMWVVPGTHRMGLISHSEPWQIGDRMDKKVPGNAFDQTKEIPIRMAAGSCSFHHSLLLHASRPNNTLQSRRGLAIHYMTSRSKWTHPSQPAPQYLLVRGREYSGHV